MSEKYELKAISDSLKDYCYMAKEDDFIEVVQWKNSEGFDITIATEKRNVKFILTHGEIRALNFLASKLELDK